MNYDNWVSETVDACEFLLARCAPRMMRAGGGGGSTSLENRKPLKRAERAKIISLWRKGLAHVKIAEKTGTPKGTVSGVIAKFKQRGHWRPRRAGRYQ